MDSEQGGATPGGEGGAPEDERPAPARPWHRTPMEPEGPPPWSSSQAGDSVFGSEEGALPAGAPGETPLAEPPAPAGPPGGLSASAAAPPPAAAPPVNPPPPAAVAAEAPPPPPARPGGGNLITGIFLYLGGASVLGGVLSLLAANNAGTSISAAVSGVSFVVLFFVAVALRPGIGMDSVRATLGVLSIVFLVVCFGLVVGLGDRHPADTSTELVRAAVAAGLLAVGMGLVAALVPSAFAAGLSVLGLVGTVVLASAASGVTAPGLAAAAAVSAAVALEVALRVPQLRAHPSATAWMVNVAAPLVALPITVLAITLRGTPVAAAGLAGATLAVMAWRRRAVVAAIVAAVPLSLVEGYVVVQVVGGDRVGLGLVELLIGLVVLVAVAVAGMRMRGRVVRVARERPVLLEEVLLAATAVVALIALSDLGGGTSGPFFPGNPFSPSGSGTNPAPSFSSSFPPVPTFPALPPEVTPPT